LARPNQLLFTNVPSFLHNVRTIRDWIMSVGGTRSVLLLPPPPKTMDGRIRNENDNSLSIDWKKSDGNITALATMTNPDVAIRVLSAFRYMATKYFHKSHEEEEKVVDESLRKFHVHPVPNNPDVPMPPIMMMDPDIVTTTGEAMYSALLRFRDGGDTSEMGPNLTTNTDSSSTNNNNGNNHNYGNVGTTNDDTMGNADEEGIDPLESPAVLEAVRKFREHLATLQGSKATKRQQLVADAIAKELPIMRQKMAQERAATATAAATTLPVPGGLLLPPPPLLPLPPPSTVPGMMMHLPPPPPPPPPPIPPVIPPVSSSLSSNIDFTPRGVSNQPAWMTQQQQQQQQHHQGNTTNLEEPPMKRIKVDVTDPTLLFPTITSDDKIAALRQYISQQIQHYIGEADETLIAFVLKHIVVTTNNSTQLHTNNSTVAALLPELKEVFDDDAIAFLQSIYEYSQQLSGGGK
jgi:hypothetical protein